jgi:uncharacterized membrane protein
LVKYAEVASVGKVERASIVLTKAYLFLSIFALVGTMVSKWLGVDPGIIAPVTTVFLILCGASVIAIGIRDFVSVFFLIIVCGASEIIGVLTGIPFGKYEYTDRWWPTVFLDGQHRFPLLIPFAWLLLLGGSYLVLRTRVNKWSAVPLCALLTTLIDMPMERAMTEIFVYWKWTPPGRLFGAPISNSIGWFVVSLVVASFLAYRDQGPANPNIWKVLASFCIFVGSCGAIHHIEPAWVVLFALGALTIWISKPTVTP